MAAIEGVDEFEEFADDMDSIVDGLSDARQNAIEATADDYVTALTQRIRATETAKGGTLYSESSPYSPGGTNDSTGSTLHIKNKGAWVTEVVGDDLGVVYPNPEVRDRVRFLEYGTKDHGPDGDEPLYFRSGGVTIVVAERPEVARSFSHRLYKETAATEGTAEAKFQFGNFEGDAGEVSGVEPQRFLREAFKDLKRGNRFKENMGNELDKLFEKRGITLEGKW